MSNKQELINKIVNLLQTEYKGREAVVTPADRAFLEGSTESFLESKLREIQREVGSKHRQQVQIMGDRHREELAWVHISRTIVNGKMPVDNAANQQIVFSWLNLDEQPTVNWFTKVLEETPALADQILWEPVLSKEQRKKAEAAQLEKDQETFAEICRKNLLSECEANFDVWRSTNSTSELAPAAPEELEAFGKEAADKRQEFLLNADPTTLRSEVRRESVEGQTAMAREQAARELEAAKQRDQYRGYRPLPPEIDSKTIKQASGVQLKQWMRLYGSYQITNRVRGEN